MNSRKRRRKLNIISLITKIILFFIILILTSYLGLKLLVNLLYFSSKLLPKKQPVLIKNNPNEEIKPSITVLSIPEATNEAKIKAILFSDNAEKIKVYVNDKLNKVIPVEDENIEVEINNLKQGKNLIYFIAFLQKTTLKTKEYPVIFDNIPPKLEIIAPQTLETNDSQIEIKGKTEPKTIVKINSIPVIVSQNGEFSRLVNLNEGENIIIINAQDEAGNITEKKLTVIKTS